MKKIPVIAIFDIGKTNKKLLLFDEEYKLVYEESKQLEEIRDEDGFPCEDVNALTHFVRDSFDNLLRDKRFEIKAVNFTAYGASFVYLDEGLNVLLHLYSYLKPYPAQLKGKFYATYGGEKYFTKITASPVLGNLNSGMQLYRIKYEGPQQFAKIKYALHLPQYISFILTGKLYSDITSVGCHTNLWDFKNNTYHQWVVKEGIGEKLPSITNSDSTTLVNETITAGIGLHDSSAALVPYLISFNEPFILISTGTWCITLNPFNDAQLTNDELQQDCLCYLSFNGKPVKASRLFAGYQHEQEVKKISEHFDKPLDYYKTVLYDEDILNKISAKKNFSNPKDNYKSGHSNFSSRELSVFDNYEEAYHQLIKDIIEQQVHSTNLVLQRTTCKRIFVDGGFSNNKIYMNLLAKAFPDMEVYAATVPQASALGAALVIHEVWNTKSLPGNMIDLKYYSAVNETLKF
ncbi:MAG: FGGY family carbohydrate kinase [Bacteroidota bacterium]|nr:FGGY family carbohydrate kinase [Bacteroidota bacterium]